MQDSGLQLIELSLMHLLEQQVEQSERRKIADAKERRKEKEAELAKTQAKAQADGQSKGRGARWIRIKARSTRPLARS